MMIRVSDVTQILDRIQRGDERAAENLLPLVYDELRKLAGAQVAREKPGQTLNATALVHEAYLRLVGDQKFENRRHFFAAASEAMRRILVDRARARLAQKRGGDGQRVDCYLAQLSTRFSDHEMIEVNSLLDALAVQDAEAGELVRLHVYGGFSVEEAGELIGLSRASAYRNWTFARAWLRSALKSK